MRTATVDPQTMYADNESRCLECGMHIVLNTDGEWQHTMQGIVPCEPAWKPKRKPLAVITGGKS